MLPKLAVVAVALAIAVLVWCWPSGPRRMPMPTAGWFALAYVGAIALVTATSRARSLSFFGAYQRYDGFLSLLLYVGLAGILVAACWRAPTRADVVLFAVGFGAALAAVYELFQWVGIDAFTFHDANGAPVQFAGSTLGNSDFAGAVFGLAAPLLVLAFVRARSRGFRVLALAALAITVAACWASHSRGGLLALFAGTAALAFLRTRHATPAARRAGMASAIACAAVVVVAVLTVATPLANHLPSPLSGMQLFRTQSANERQYEWRAAVRATSQRPVLGSGPDTFLLDYPRARSRADAIALGAQLADKPHNLPLERAVTGGIVGLGTYLAFVGCLLVFGIRRRRDVARVDGAAAAWTIDATLAAFAAYLVQSWFSFDVPPLALAFWTLTAVIVITCDPKLVAARHAIENAPRPRARRGAKRTKASPTAPNGTVVARSAAGVVAFVLVGVAGVALAADARAGAGDRAAASRHWVAAISAYDDAITLAPMNPAYRVDAAEVAERGADDAHARTDRKHNFAVAIARYREALRSSPGNEGIEIELARTLTSRAAAIDPRDFPAADSVWASVVASDPNDPAVRELRGVALTAWANATGDTSIRRRAETEFRTLTALEPRSLDGWIDLGRTEMALGKLQDARRAAYTAATIAPRSADAKALLEQVVHTDPAGH
jgi:O-antigen ligase/cytochrome c-type biogenesis protein CcmH/NrfG